MKVKYYSYLGAFFWYFAKTETGIWYRSTPDVFWRYRSVGDDWISNAINNGDALSVTKREATYYGKAPLNL